MRMLGVCGAADAVGDDYERAFEVGELIAEAGFALVCGGLGGVMEAACKGAKKRGGTTIGIIPGDDARSANDYVDFAIVTAMGHARNLMIVQSASAVVALSGGAGTLSEIALAMKVGTPVVTLGDWDDIDGPAKASSPREAVKKAVELAKIQP